MAVEIAKCECCEDKPCKMACPCACSPADFIKAVEFGDLSDLKRAASLILEQNPLGGVCGQVCPDKHCMAACVHKEFDSSVNIPQVQATIIEQAKRRGAMPRFDKAASNGKKIAIIGGGPAGLAAAASLAIRGYEVNLHEQAASLGGMCRAIPEFRLDKEVLESDIEWVLRLGHIKIEFNRGIKEPQALLDNENDAVLVASGLWMPIRLGIPNEEYALYATEFLSNLSRHEIRGKVAVIGGGAAAFDCAITALHRGAQSVEMFALETLSEMPLTQKEMQELVQSGIDVNGRIKVDSIDVSKGKISGLQITKVRLKTPFGTPVVFDPNLVESIPGTGVNRNDFDQVIIAIGNKASFSAETKDPRIFYGGDCVEGPTTVVEAVAAGKEAAEKIHAALEAKKHVATKGRSKIPGYNSRPVSLETDFFGRTILSPFLLSAAPPTDGLEQMERAYAAGWAGGIMKTAFDGVPIHIPSEYMFVFGDQTYANCDNVSGHALARVCKEVEFLTKKYPERLTIASTGGPVSGNDERDRLGWQRNTQKLENAGAMGIEYSLSCPQGGDGTEGDIVSQNAKLTAKIIDWVMAAGDASVPKLFKLTGAVTSIVSIVSAIKEVFEKYPEKKAGITLANTFPTLIFRQGKKTTWEEGIVVGMSGEGALNISYLTLAKVAHLGVVVSGNGGPMNYKAAADFLALGARTVQFCTVVMKYGYGIVDDLHS
ncbi:MAG: FAD-dependent oxidoreductase, partial [Pseudomonadota bacterium]